MNDLEARFLDYHRKRRRQHRTTLAIAVAIGALIGWRTTR